ncbi:hypothetical protein B0H66DRAFT_597167 [Apodospora peruviana]|uniref:Autophagy protein n=1 Tax=Apodospora peruviana TaxID=516989 RepID=A0AAE0IRE4_9PEZI|nr:hypothetical protein B0H66DRAFT_597167 [Apodospora peruviana]
MGLFDGWFGGNSDSNDSDPLRRLDPKLREFLQKESPVKYTKATSDDISKQQLQNKEKQEKLALEKQQQAAIPTTENDQPPKVPKESLFQDGRYAHLWKNYRPLGAIEAEAKNDHEKLMDVLEAFKDRKAMIGRAALENCADEQMDWNSCMKSGSVRARMTMCSTEVKKFEHCYMTQTRLLKALGYLSAYRSPEVDEQIQMHADALYHRIVEQEAAIDQAKKEGKPVPSFQSVLGQEREKLERLQKHHQTPEVPEPAPEMVESWKEKLDKLKEEDRAAEEEALKAEHKAKAEMAARIQELWAEQAKEREARKAEGRETIGDKVKGFFGK